MVNTWKMYACEACGEQYHSYENAEECEEMHGLLLRKYEQEYSDNTNEISIDLEDAVLYIAKRMSYVRIGWIRDTLKYDWERDV